MVDKQQASAVRQVAAIIEILEECSEPLAEHEPLAQAAAIRVNGHTIGAEGPVIIRAGLDTVQGSGAVLVLVDAWCALPRPVATLDEAACLTQATPVRGERPVELFYDRDHGPLAPLTVDMVLPACGARIGDQFVLVADTADFPLLITAIASLPGGVEIEPPLVRVRLPLFARRIIVDTHPATVQPVPAAAVT
jgi:hypothetical protein